MESSFDPLLTQISNAIIFREKLRITLHDNSIPFEFHPYYLLSHDDGINFLVKGYRIEDPKLMVNFETKSIKKCEYIEEVFPLEEYPDPELTANEVLSGYRIYTNIY